MKKRLPFIIGLIVICAFAFLYAHVNKAHPIYDNDVDTATYSAMGVMGTDQIIRQEFVCMEEHLDGFYLKLDIVGTVDDVNVLLAVKDVQTGTVLAENEYTVSGVKNRKLNYFGTDSVTGYKEKSLELTICQKGGDSANGISLYKQSGAVDAPMYVNEEASDGVLVMKHVSERFDLETFFVTVFFCCFIWAFLWFLYRLFR